MKLRSVHTTRSILGVMFVCAAVAAAPRAACGPIDDLQPGRWYEAPNTQLRPVVPVPTPPGSPVNIMAAWSGGAYDPSRDRLIVWGGGHGDYGGNEIYTFDIDTMTWARIWGPSPIEMIQALTGAACLNTYADGNPVSRHTYGGLQYLPIQDRFFIQGGSRYCGSGGSGIDTWTFDLVGLRWERKADFPVCSVCGSLEHVTGYDPSTGHVFLAAPGYVLHEYNPSANTWTARSDRAIASRMNGTIDTKRRKFVAIGDGRVYVYNLNTTGTIVREAPSTSGATAIISTSYPGVVYDPVSDRVVAWSGGADVYSLNMDTMVWTRHTTTGSVIPTSAPGAGTYGRFQYIPSKNAFIAVNRIDENVYFYKLSAGGGAPADSIPPSVPAAFRPR